VLMNFRSISPHVYKHSRQWRRWVLALALRTRERVCKVGESNNLLGMMQVTDERAKNMSKL